MNENLINIYMYLTNYNIYLILCLISLNFLHFDDYCFAIRFFEFKITKMANLISDIVTFKLLLQNIILNFYV